MITQGSSHAPTSLQPESGRLPWLGRIRVEFRLKVEPGGPMAPMINAMIKPLMPSFAEDFAGKLVGHLEAQQGPR